MNRDYEVPQGEFPEQKRDIADVPSLDKVVREHFGVPRVGERPCEPASPRDGAVMYTEEEAKKMWCPFARLATSQVVGFNRAAARDLDAEPLISRACCCMTSACMAWRFGPEDYVTDDAVELSKPAGETNPPFSNCPEGYKVTRYGHTEYRAEKNGRIVKRGYCGLAGKR